MWRGILGHDEVVERFRRTMAARRLASTYLFVGAEGVGKRRFATELARTLLCPAADLVRFEPCGHCESCRLFAVGNHPDLDIISLPPDKSTLPIALFVGDQEHRNQVGLCHWISLRPFLGNRRVAIIDDADHFSQESANCLLKTLEEPPPDSVLILIGTSLGRQLPTIRSRAQVVPFRELPSECIEQILLRENLVPDAANAREVAKAGGGSMTRARELADLELREFRSLLTERIARPAWDVQSMEKAVIDFVQSAGTESSARRERLRTVIGFAIDHYRARLVPSGASEAAAWPSDQGAALHALEACLSAVEHVDRNANQALVVSHWLRSLAG
jgi:DNA polymerase-3 subunit delta'